ncbi:hypothetical protein GL218_03884 [Daldinia childiae]|uniref:uncharacterized protein n=1 Tax=Daldinia childiae TaxID=326645 RepID=UPI00144636D7|nr:uncharacterized protein GL218_03884 [Daldinia childiae]KAF3062469.1 hypothetical protein GL218_03884 [Daldinia childiae]
MPANQQDQAPLYSSEVKVVAPKPIRPLPSSYLLIPALEVAAPSLTPALPDLSSIKLEEVQPDELNQSRFRSFLRLSSVEPPTLLRRRVSTGLIRRWGKGQCDTEKITYEENLNKTQQQRHVSVEA